MEITIKNLQRAIPIQPTKMKKVATSALLHEKIKDASLSIVFVSPQRMRSINKQYLSHDYVTDVITFDLGSSKKNVDGEIFICPAEAKKNAKEYKTSIVKELSLYVIHGILHLLGYDDHNAKDVARIRKKEQQLMEVI